MVEDLLIQDMADRGVSVDRSLPFASCTKRDDGTIDVVCNDTSAGEAKVKTVNARYLVGCDGSRSLVRPYIPNAQLEGGISSASWGVLDGKYSLLLLLFLLCFSKGCSN